MTSPNQPLWMPQTVEQVNEFMESLTFTDEEVDPAELPPPPGPDDEILVVLSLRVSMATADRIRKLAESRGEKYTLMLRRWVEAEVAAAETGPVDRAELLHAVDVLHRIGLVA